MCTGNSTTTVSMCVQAVAVLPQKSVYKYQQYLNIVIKPALGFGWQLFYLFCFSRPCWLQAKTLSKIAFTIKNVSKFSLLLVFLSDFKFSLCSVGHHQRSSMGGVWRPRRCLVDWEHEHGIGWQQDVVSGQQWAYQADGFYTHVVRSTRSGSCLPCHC